MIAELGVAWLGIALALSLMLASIPYLQPKLVTSGYSFASLRRFASRITFAHNLMIWLSFLCLVWLYVQSDFSVMNVVANSHSLKPFLYKLTGTWGNHEGSMLLWVVVLASYMAVFAWLQRGHDALETFTLSHCALIAAGFELFILATSNPFARVFPPLSEGQGLNPPLQDVGLAIHPPMLYGGYVGFAIAFGIAVAALRLRLDDHDVWAKIMRPWVLVAWSFLALGIGVGSWWAYRELGWGGWWFWDPVENASLMPWLVGTALIHSLIGLTRRGHFANWTLLLALLTFTLSLLGTFLVRSGILSSVHSFANDPTRGLYILGFIVLISGGALFRYAQHRPTPTAVDFAPSSKEGVIMVQNLLQLVLCGTIMLGVLYPLGLQLLELPSVTVGPPYFEKTFIPLAVIAAFIAVIGPTMIWRNALPQRQRQRLLQQGALWLMAAFLLSLLLWHKMVPGNVSYWPSLPGTILGVWLMVMTLRHFFTLHRPSLSAQGMALAHFGFGMVVAAVALSSGGRLEKELLMRPSDGISIGEYALTLRETQTHYGSNYVADRAIFDITTPKGKAFQLQPEMRLYPEHGTRTPESSLHTTAWHDLYVVVGDAREDGYLIRFYITPAIGWLWAGFIFVMLGGTIAAKHAFATRK